MAVHPHSGQTIPLLSGAAKSMPGLEIGVGADRAASARQYGFYVGPLKPEGVDKAMAPIHPYSDVPPPPGT